LRDGRLLNILRTSELAFRSFEIRGIPESQSVELMFGDQRLLIQLTNDELPPAAPARLVNAFTMMRPTDRPDPLEFGSDPARRQQELLQQLIQQAPLPAADKPKRP
jgi:hypothetical protein